MNTQDVVTLISNIGFPIVCCGAMAWYFKYRDDQRTVEIKELNQLHSDEVKSLNEQHKNDIEKMITAINNNTIAFNSLCDKLEGVIRK